MITLYDHQLDALEKMHNGCILCGGVGSGKSITALAYYYLQCGGNYNAISGSKSVFDDIFIEGVIPDLYIITTARKRDTFEWEEELSKLYFSTDEKLNLYSNKVVVDSWNNITKYKEVTNAFFIFDEQRVCGSGVWVKSFINIANHNQWILLSATPGDTWSDYIPVFIANGFYRNRSEFIREHVIFKPFRNYPIIDRYVNLKRLTRLRDRILVDMEFYRQTVPHHETIPVEYDKITYKRIVKDRWDIWKDEPIANASAFCYALRRVINEDESRMIAVLEILEKHPKAIIFYNFDYELEILRNLGYAEGTEVHEWNSHKHQEIPVGEKWVYLVQYNAGNEGWNCITTDTIIFYSQNYSYKIITQAAGRIDRINTKFIDLYYYHLQSRASIDLSIKEALITKKKFNEARFANF